MHCPRGSPKNAHNAVTNIGDDLKIVRANMPFAHTSKGEYGTYFIAYASTFSTTRRMLENMFVGDPVVMYLNNFIGTSKNYGRAGAVSAIMFVICAVLCVVIMRTTRGDDERKPKPVKAAKAVKGGKAA